MVLPETIASPPEPRHVTRALGAIAFEHVSFEYRRGEPVLRDLSFRVEPGQKIAIVGATGSGKTTVIKLLNRFYDVTAGPHPGRRRRCPRMGSEDARVARSD